MAQVHDSFTGGDATGNYTFNGPAAQPNQTPPGGAFAEISDGKWNVHVTASATGFPYPVVSAYASGGGTAGAGINYYFAVTEPAMSSSPISVGIRGSILDGVSWAASGPFGSVSAQLFIQDTSNNAVLLRESVVIGSDGIGPTQTQFDVPLSLVTNRTYRVNMGVGVGANGSGASAFAILDPYIYIDQNFPGSDLYSIVVSDGIGNTSATSVPEPATALLLAACSVILTTVRANRPRSFRP